MITTAAPTTPPMNCADGPCRAPDEDGEDAAGMLEGVTGEAEVEEDDEVVVATITGCTTR
jgi:hypothetical protein